MITKYVTQSHPTVMARCMTWDDLKANFKVDAAGFVEYPMTTQYGLPAGDGVLTPETVGNEIWMLGPFPDGGFWVTEDLGDYTEVPEPPKSLANGQSH